MTMSLRSAIDCHACKISLGRGRRRRGQPPVFGAQPGCFVAGRCGEILAPIVVECAIESRSGQKGRGLCREKLCSCRNAVVDRLECEVPMCAVGVVAQWQRRLQVAPRSSWSWSPTDGTAMAPRFVVMPSAATRLAQSSTHSWKPSVCVCGYQSAGNAAWAEYHALGSVAGANPFTVGAEIRAADSTGMCLKPRRHRVYEQ
jgi:hypothetical protein